MWCELLALLLPWPGHALSGAQPLSAKAQWRPTCSVHCSAYL